MSPTPATSRPMKDGSDANLSQEELDRLLSISGFIGDGGQTDRKSLIDEIKDAILNSGTLSLDEWMGLRDRLKEIERLVPTIDLIIELKQQLKKK
ncbi:MAG TPA: hypothetical protein VHX44_06820 [Planctomycetota bacterium]|jgi:hypothetical protein|nr:hypothetical protein [Planctomycetota bacterium]